MSDSPLTTEQQVTYLRGMLEEAGLLDPLPEEVGPGGGWASSVRMTLESAPPFISPDAKGEVYSQTGVAEPEDLILIDEIPAPCDISPSPEPGERDVH
jgi:hypothetical protein